jgi:hypothetical protein
MEGYPSEVMGVGDPDVTVESGVPGGGCLFGRAFESEVKLE